MSTATINIAASDVEPGLINLETRNGIGGTWPIPLREQHAKAFFKAMVGEYAKAFDDYEGEQMQQLMKESLESLARGE